jgi:acyl carrier protein
MLVPTGNSALFAAVTHQIVDLIHAEVGDVELTSDSDLQDLGLDSLKVMSLVFKLEASHDIHLEEEDADDLQTIGDLAQLVVTRIEEAQ